MEWGVSEVFKIIALYRQYPCLWEYRSPDYKRIDLKRNAWEEIGKEMGKSVEEVKKKIKYLRSAYVGEKKKATSSKSSGAGTEDIYRPHLFYYEEFSFLDTVVVLRQTSSNLIKQESCAPIEVSPELYSIECGGSENSPDFTQTNSSLNASSCLTTSTPVSDKPWKGLKRSRMARDNKFNEALDSIITKVSSTNVEETIFSAFAKSIEMQLEELPLDAATTAMAEIQQILSLKITHFSKTSI